MLEKTEPTCVRRLVCFANAIYENRFSIGAVRSIKVGSVEKALELTFDKIVPVLVDPDLKILETVTPDILIDARMSKQKTDCLINLAKIVIGLGPGFTTGVDCQAVIETKRGKNLGAVILDGAADKYNAIPASLNGFTTQRILRSPKDGFFRALCKITDMVKAGDIIGSVDNLKVISQIDGIVRGLIYENLEVRKNQKIGDIDPRGDKNLCYKQSDKASAIGFGVLKALKTFQLDK